MLARGCLCQANHLSRWVSGTMSLRLCHKRVERQGLPRDIEVHLSSKAFSPDFEIYLTLGPLLLRLGQGKNVYPTARPDLSAKLLSVPPETSCSSPIQSSLGRGDLDLVRDRKFEDRSLELPVEEKIPLGFPGFFTRMYWNPTRVHLVMPPTGFDANRLERATPGRDCRYGLKCPSCRTTSHSLRYDFLPM